MHRFGNAARVRRRPLRLLGIGLLACVGVVYLLTLDRSGAKASPPPQPSALYPALDTNAPLGLTLASAQAIATTSVGSQGPVWRSEGSAAGPNQPLPQTIRRLPSTEASVTSWIAESSEKGICVMLSPNRKINGIYVVGATCTDGPSGNAQGTSLTYQYPDSDEVAVAGVAPAGVSSVTVTFSDGDTQAVPVSGDGWALSTAEQPVTYTLPGNAPVVIGGE